MQDSPMNLSDDELLDDPKTQAFIALLKGSIATEGNSYEELEERSEELARLPEVSSGETNTWRAV